MINDIDPFHVAAGGLENPRAVLIARDLPTDAETSVFLVRDFMAETNRTVISYPATPAPKSQVTWVSD